MGKWDLQGAMPVWKNICSRPYDAVRPLSLASLLSVQSGNNGFSQGLRGLSLAKFSMQVVNSSQHLALYFLIQGMMELANGLAAQGK